MLRVFHPPNSLIVQEIDTLAVDVEDDEADDEDNEDDG